MSTSVTSLTHVHIDSSQRFVVSSPRSLEAMRRQGITNEELRDRVKEVDLRDGTEANRLDAAPVSCPSCQQKVTAGALHCIHCGAKITPEYPFER